MPPQIDDAVKRRIHATLRSHFLEHFEVDLGLLQFELLLDAVLRTIGSAVYNQAVADAQAYIQTRLLDMEGDLHETLESPG